jgi:lipase chaperone LimK
VVKFLKLDSTPLDLRVAAGRDLYNFAIKAMNDKEASVVMKKNRKMITTIFEDQKLAKDILGKM